VGGPITNDMTGTEWYATIFAFAESPLTPNVLWSGSDDGLVYLSRDRGTTWTNVTPSGLPKFTRVSIIEPSHADTGTAYLAANRYQLDDFQPYLFKTTNYGKSWTRITTGIPQGAYTRTIREDPVRRGLLYAGTETGVYYSTDDGARWSPLQLNLPRTSVRDLWIRGSDLIAATHGRAIWILDDVTPLRQSADSVRAASVFLFGPDTAIRFLAGSSNGDGSGENPPAGVLVDYWLKPALDPQDSIRLEFLGPDGQIIRHFSSAPPPDSAMSAASARQAAADSLAGITRRSASSGPQSNSGRASRDLSDDTLAFAPSDSIVAARAGLNRFVWDLRYPSTHEIKGIINDEGVTTGPMVAPGLYSVRLVARGRTLTRTFVVRADPRITTVQADYEAQLALAREVQDKTNDLSAAVARIQSLDDAIDARVADTKGQSYAGRVADAAKPIRAKLDAVRDSLAEMHSHVDEITLHYPIRDYNMLLSLAQMVQSADAAPTAQEAAVYRDLSAKVDRHLAVLHAIESTDVATFNQLLKDLNVPGVLVPPPLQ
jgi:hypothetical protein